MKKVNKSVQKQARRERALERFSIGSGDADYKRRKQQEHAALHRNLGLPYTPSL